MAKEKCANPKCGCLLNGRYVPINGDKYCTVTCAQEATGLRRDPRLDNWLIDGYNQKIVLKHP